MWCWRILLRIPWTLHRTKVYILKWIFESAYLRCVSNILVTLRGGQAVISKGEGDGQDRGERPRSLLRWVDQISTLNSTIHGACTLLKAETGDELSLANILKQWSRPSEY